MTSRAPTADPRWRGRERPGRLGRLVVLLAPALVAGCGLPAGGPVETVSTPAAPADRYEPRPPPEGGRRITVFFVRGSDLEAVPRRVADPRPQVAVDLLLAGPTRREVLAGLRTALPPQDVIVSSGPGSNGLVVVAVSRPFVGITGGDQLLAVAQVVWTVTQFPQVDRVCFALDGVLVQVPTDAGLSDVPVGRWAYTSVAADPAGAAPATTGAVRRRSAG